MTNERKNGYGALRHAQFFPSGFHNIVTSIIPMTCTNISSQLEVAPRFTLQPKLCFNITHGRVALEIFTLDVHIKKINLPHIQSHILMSLLHLCVHFIAMLCATGNLVLFG